MATLTIRNLPDDVRDQLRIRAAHNGRSMEAEARAALSQSVLPKPATLSPDDIRERVRKVQYAMAKYRRPGVLASEELIAERRLDAQRETFEAAIDGQPARAGRKARQKRAGRGGGS